MTVSEVIVQNCHISHTMN